jgi:hypothetical protein
MSEEAKDSREHIPTIYTIGYQPIDLIDVRFRVVDIINMITSAKPAADVNLRIDIINFIEENKILFNDDYLFINSKTNRTFLPYSASRRTIVYDPPYVAQQQDAAYLLGLIQRIIGVKEKMNKEVVTTLAGSYNNSLNGMRNLIFQSMGMLDPANTFNAMMLLSDMNSCKKVDLQKYIEKNATFKPNPEIEYKYIMYMGDPVNPSFFNDLLNEGYYVVKYYPYETYLLPCDDLGTYYSSNFMFQTPLFNCVSIRSFIHELIAEQNKSIEFCIINPGSVYLTREEAECYMRKLKDDIPFKVIKGYNPSVADLEL